MEKNDETKRKEANDEQEKFEKALETARNELPTKNNLTKWQKFKCSLGSHSMKRVHKTFNGFSITAYYICTRCGKENTDSFSVGF